MKIKEWTFGKIHNQLPEERLREVAVSVDYVREQRGFWISNFRKCTPEEIVELEKERPTTRLLSIHVINGCNLACRACNHNSSLLGVNSRVDIDALKEDIKNILPKIHVWLSLIHI